MCIDVLNTMAILSLRYHYSVECLGKKIIVYRHVWTMYVCMYIPVEQVFVLLTPTPLKYWPRVTKVTQWQKFWDYHQTKNSVFLGALGANRQRSYPPGHLRYGKGLAGRRLMPSNERLCIHSDSDFVFKWRYYRTYTYDGWHQTFYRHHNAVGGRHHGYCGLHNVGQCSVCIRTHFADHAGYDG